jgi:hypothetical protein
MRAAAFALAILLGGTAAVAQTTNTGTTDQSAGSTTANMDQAQPSTTSTDTSVQTQTGWNNTATTGMTMASNTAATGAVVQPDNTAPKRDARGVPVISAPAVVPIGYNGTTGNAMGGPLLDPTSGQPIAAASARPCTRTVTDHCVQTYEHRRAR